MLGVVQLLKTIYSVFKSIDYNMYYAVRTIETIHRQIEIDRRYFFLLKTGHFSVPNITQRIRIRKTGRMVISVIRVLIVAGFCLPQIAFVCK
jgi:hypothetical protein